MNTVRCILIALLTAALAAPAAAVVPRSIIRAFLDAAVPATSFALVVQESGHPQPLFAHNADTPMNPASVMKLVTTLAALELLGREYRWKTEAYLGGPLVDGVLKGDLILKGYGDPKITVEAWQAFMMALRSAGLAAVEGDLVLDRSYFSLRQHDAGAFDGEPLKPYNVGPDALLVNFKTVRLMFGADPALRSVVVRAEPPLAPVSIGAPPRFASGPCNDWRGTIGASIADFGGNASLLFSGRYPAACGEQEWWIALLDHRTYVHAMFARAFTLEGGRFSGGVREGRAPAGAAPFMTLESAPLYDIVRDVNKLSNNVMARQLFLTLATTAFAPPATVENAAKAIARWLDRKKLRMPGLVLENGSGLSRNERATARGLARLLAAADASTVRDEFASSLAVAALDGTVQHRFRDGSVAEQALLKTGSLEGVRALAGYVIDAEGRRFIVVAIVNHANAGGAQRALDHLVQWVYQSAGSWVPPPVR